LLQAVAVVELLKTVQKKVVAVVVLVVIGPEQDYQ
jgi:hypothetical protein